MRGYRCFGCVGIGAHHAALRLYARRCAVNGKVLCVHVHVGDVRACDKADDTVAGVDDGERAQTHRAEEAGDTVQGLQLVDDIPATQGNHGTRVGWA